jgi:hypothetical protein
VSIVYGVLYRQLLPSRQTLAEGGRGCSQFDLMDGIQRIYDGGRDPTDIWCMVDGIQVEKVLVASQSRPGNVWI